MPVAPYTPFPIVVDDDSDPDAPIAYTVTAHGETVAALDEACGSVPPPPSGTELIS